MTTPQQPDALEAAIEAAWKRYFDQVGAVAPCAALPQRFVYAFLAGHAHAQQDSRKYLEALRQIQDFIWNLPQDGACAAYAVADRLLEGTPYHVAVEVKKANELAAMPPPQL